MVSDEQAESALNAIHLAPVNEDILRQYIQETKALRRAMEVVNTATVLGPMGKKMLGTLTEPLYRIKEEQ